MMYRKQISIKKERKVMLAIHLGRMSAFYQENLIKAVLINEPLKRRYSSRTFRYGYLVTT
jgi:hypothetical protein